MLVKLIVQKVVYPKISTGAACSRGAKAKAPINDVMSRGHFSGSNNIYTTVALVWPSYSRSVRAAATVPWLS